MSINRFVSYFWIYLHNPPVYHIPQKMSLIHRRPNFNSGLEPLWTCWISGMVEKLSSSWEPYILMSINSDDIIFYDLFFFKGKMKIRPPADGKCKCCGAFCIDIWICWYCSYFMIQIWILAILRTDLLKIETCSEISFGLSLWSFEYVFLLCCYQLSVR